MNSIILNLFFGITGRAFLSKAELAGSTVVRALQYLEQNDFIEHTEGRYRVIDPLLKGMILKLTSF